jgi:hypothetical protein
LREAQPEYRMYVRASWAVMCVYFYIACRRVRTDGRELFFEASGGMLMAVEVGPTRLLLGDSKTHVPAASRYAGPWI